MFKESLEPITRSTSSPTWGANLEPAICEQCDWRYLVPAGLLPIQCPHCFQATLTSVVGQADSLSSPQAPELLIPFSVSIKTLEAKIEQFAGAIWFAPGDLTPHSLKTRLQRLYLPMWLVDSRAEAMWQAEAGFNYEAVTHRDSFDENTGGWRSQQLTETRIRWEPRLGRLNRAYHNIPAPALEEHFALLASLGEYDLTAGQNYQPQAIDQALIRLPNRAPADAWPDAIPALQATAAEECRQASGADHIREFRWTAGHQDQNWTLLLLPVYVTYYLDDDRRPQPVLIHGQTGQLSAPRRASMRQAQQAALLILAVAAVVFVLSLLAALISFLFPPLFFLAGLGVVGAGLIGLLAIAPVIIAWQYNRTRKN
jgi:hypothetical protein